MQLNADFLKPTTQIFVQQPSSNIDAFNQTIIQNEHIYKKPIAYVLPIEKTIGKDKSVQTDFPLDSGSLIDIGDFERSQRFIGILENKDILNNVDFNEIALLRSRVGLLQNALDEQKTRNEEVKKLLMVSLGNDLASHFSQLMSDFTSTESRISSLLTEKRIINESADHLSIQADLWKNKYFAGRILVNELAAWKEKFALRYQESLDSIHGLLQERHSLRVHLSLMSDRLAQIATSLRLRHAVTPCTYGNTMDLVRHCLEVATTVAKALSAGDSTGSGSSANQRKLTGHTAAEEGALQVLQKRPMVGADPSGRYITSFAAGDQRHVEQMALTVCRNCRGDIFVV